MPYNVHTAESAPEAAKPILQATQKGIGFIPNLFGVMASAPALVEAYATLASLFDKTSLSAAERQTVLLTTSFENNCEYCMAAHTAIASMQKVPQDVIAALRSGGPIPNTRLEALRLLTRAIVVDRGRPSEAALDQFFAAGFTQEQVLEVVLGVGLKTISNYTNHISDTPLDGAFAPVAWKKAA